MTHEDGLRPEESLYPIIDLRAAQRRTSLTAIYPFAGLGTAQALMYIGLGLAGEAGEVANQVKKIARDDGGMLTPERRDKIFKEVRDVLWYWLRFCEEMGFDPYHVMASMFEKLEVRHANGTIQGDGEGRAIRLGVDPGSPLGFILSQGLVGEVRTDDVLYPEGRESGE